MKSINQLLLLIGAVPFFLYSEVKSPQEIDRELQSAEKEFNQALNIFNPWYTGPLLTPGSSMMPVGTGNSQPYFFVTDNYGSYDANRNAHRFHSDQLQIKAAANIQTGITDNFDLNLAFQGLVNWQAKEEGGGYGDTSLTGGFLVLKQTPWIPGIKFTVAQTFPTGKYQNLSFNGLGLNATGAGAFSTQVGLIIAKVVLWNTQHPMNMRLFAGYQRSTSVDVRNFNAYGGGHGTRGTIYPGDVLTLDFGYEYSFTQRFVFATDLVYTSANRTLFYGDAGQNQDGSPASIGSGSSDNLSLSPALEYNFSPNVGLIAGVWFSVYGRNSLDFLSGVVSITISFP